HLSKASLLALRQSSMELERRAVVRVLSERAMHAGGVIEDGSTAKVAGGKARTYRGRDGKMHPMVNMQAAVHSAVEQAFPLDTPERALAWLDALGPLPADGHRFVAFPGPKKPEYYDSDMQLKAVVDRGDVWYDFPYGPEGKKRGQPTARRPSFTLFVRYLDQDIPLVRYGTTIGGWRTESVEGTVMWKYKNSPTGNRVWSEIVAAPVWIPPESTPASGLLKKRGRRNGKMRYRVNYHEIGPSYASAYGLVAAYHLRFRQGDDGSIQFGADEGIRTHGSVDYMSIQRRHSHGCHRLHNHLAVRLMSFVLAHRPHTRVGQQRVGVTRVLEHEGQTYRVQIKQGGYVFRLDQPLKVSVRQGRIRGQRKTPIAHALPRFDEEVGAYVMPDGSTVGVTPT
ncbi:MAG: hypothetical protein ACPGUV_15310, partial [Polyangiales bacterium]